MAVVINGTTGVSGVDGSAGTPSYQGTDSNTGIFFPAADTIAFAEGGAEAMRLDSSGNVGIGVTPSAWGTNKALQVERGGITSYISVQTDLFQNCYYDGSNWKYMATDEANKLTMLNGQFIMYSAPSGTAGNNITFTEVFQVNKDKTIALQGATQQTGTGITFPATQSASTDANTLDDYEEGTWTPTILGSTTAGTTTYTTQVGRYTKVGRLVTASGYVVWSNATGTGGLLIGGLPFTAQNVTNLYQGVALGWSYNVTTPANTIPMLYISPNGTNITVYGTLVAGGASVQVVVDTAGEFIYTATYLAD